MIWLLLALVLVATPAEAQLWSGILAPARAVRWQDNAGVEGGIPSGSWTQCGATLNPPQTAAQINTAISNCVGPGFVKLGGTNAAPATFNLSAAINFAAKQNVVLRGGGPMATKIVF